MARLASEKKMGYYPTPELSNYWICKWISLEEWGSKCHFLDPCCGEGDALIKAAPYGTTTWGIELDVERAISASDKFEDVLQCSLFDVRISPKSIGLLWLNPPYNSENGERTEMKFLKHSIKWLCCDGIIVFIIPEHILEREKDMVWIGQHFSDITILRLHRDDYPLFKQVVLFGRKRLKRVEEVEEKDVMALPPYDHIEDREVKEYLVPLTEGPKVFRSTGGISDEEIVMNRQNVLASIKKLAGHAEEAGSVKPLFPLKKGHLVSLITAGYLDGKVYNPDGSFIVVKGFSDRVANKRYEEDKEITTHTYSVGIRVIEQKGGWYDIR